MQMRDSARSLIAGHERTREPGMTRQDQGARKPGNAAACFTQFTNCAASRRLPTSRFQPGIPLIYACTGASPSAFAMRGLPPERMVTFSAFRALIGLAFAPVFGRDLAFVARFFAVFFALPAGFMSSCFFVLSLECPQALSSSTCPDCIRSRHGRDFSARAR